MPPVTAEAFRKLNLLAGTARSLEQKTLTSEDSVVFNRDFDWFVSNLNKVDADLGRELAGEKEFYLAACQVAKGYFNDKPFGGLKCSTGQYGMNLIAPQHFKNAASGTHGPFSWVQTVVPTGASASVAETTDADIFGNTGAPYYAETTAEEKEVIAWHTLISYKPSPRVIALCMEVNDYPYVPWVVEIFSRITKPYKLFKFLPMPGRVILHPGGKVWLRAFFDMQCFESTPPATPNIDIDIAPFGLTFAENGQFVAANII